MKPRGLTEKQKRFVDFYIETGSATETERRAGYKQPLVQGAQNLEKLRVKEAISKRLKEMESQRVASAAEVFQYLIHFCGNLAPHDAASRLQRRSAPQGSQMMYALGVGAFGKAENEMILQRGGLYKIIKDLLGKRLY